jgi:hypothetical protein
MMGGHYNREVIRNRNFPIKLVEEIANSNHKNERDAKIELEMRAKRK